MAKDFSFLFYPGDVLRHIQFFSKQQKGCYLEVLTSHIENIRFSYDFLMKITRELNEVDANEFISIFDKDEDGYFIGWAIEAITKRSAYIASRGSNKQGKTKTKKQKSYENHMENKIENKIEYKEESKTKKEKEPEQKLVYPFDSQDFKLKWNVLIGEKKWRKKSNRALQAALQTLSEYSEQEAIQMIQNSIAGEYQGIFPLNNKSQNAKSIKQLELDKFRAENKDRLRDLLG